MSKLIFGILLLFVNIYGLDDSYVMKLLPIFTFLFIIFEEFVLRKTKFILFSKELFFVLVIIIIVSRGTLSSQRTDISFQFNLFKVLSFFLFIAAFTLTIKKYLKTNSFLKTFLHSVYIPITIFLALNLLLFFLGLKRQGYEIGNSILLSYLGVTISRVEFFLSVGINAYGVLVGVLFNMSLIGLWIVKKHKKIFTIGLITSFISLLLTDSRGPFLYSVIIFLIIKFIYFKSSKPKLLWLIPIIGLFGPLLMLFTLELLSQTSFGASLSRSPDDLATGNSRAVIWALAISDFFVYKPQHIFGYGDFGHYTAGLSEDWAFVFGDKEGAEFMHPHNTFISIALDYGYFGLLMITLFQFKILGIIKKIWSKHKNIAAILLGFVIYFNLVGIGETIFGFYYKNVIYVFFMINIFPFIIKSNFNLKKK
jgi:O-antigen ligase